MEKIEIKEVKLGDEEKALETSLTSEENRTVLEDSTRQDNETTENVAAGEQHFEPQPKKKLSGAQLRKLRKQQKIANGTWREQKPRRYDSRRSSGGESQTSYDSRRSSGGGSQTSGNSIRWNESRKRSYEDTGTEPQVWKKIKESPGQSESVLRMAVIDVRHPEITLNQDQADLIQERLITAMDDTPGGSADSPQFTKTTFSGGVLWITCFNETTKTWLKRAIASMTDLWKGADLITVESKNLPKGVKVLARIPGKEESVDLVRTRLEKQNPGLLTGTWQLLSKKVEKDGHYMAFTIDPASFEVLKRKQYRAFFKLGVITFKVLKGFDNRESKEGSHSSVHEQESPSRFVRYTDRPSHPVMNYSDKGSVQSLENVVVTSPRPREEATPTILEGKDIPIPWTCTTFIPNEHGERLSSEKILARLRASNRRLNTYLWTVWRVIKEEKGTLWTFSLDKESMEEIRNLDMQPYFGIGRLRFYVKDRHSNQEQTYEKEASSFSAPPLDFKDEVYSRDATYSRNSHHHQEDRFSKNEINPVSRFPASEEVVSFVEDEVGQMVFINDSRLRK